MGADIFTCSDMSEVIEFLAEDIFKQLLKEADKLKNNQKAVEVVERRLKLLINSSPHNKAVIKKAADIAGERFVKVLSEAKEKAKLFERGATVGVPFGNISIKQHPLKGE